MKYLAICLLSLASLITTAGASQSPAIPAIAALAPAPALENALGDRALAGALAAALVALQLRRRQKSLLMPRPLN
jgi:hypothetical protein